MGAPRVAAPHRAWLSKADWQDIRRAVVLAQSLGGKYVEMHGVTIGLRFQAHPVESTGQQAQSNQKQSQPANPPQRPREQSTISLAEPISREPNAKQRRQAARKKEYLQRKQLLNCKLRRVLLHALRRLRWERMHRVWTEWMQAQPAAQPTAEALMLEAPKPAEKRGRVDQNDPSSSEASSPRSTSPARSSTAAVPATPPPKTKQTGRHRRKLNFRPQLDADKYVQTYEGKYSAENGGWRYPPLLDIKETLEKYPHKRVWKVYPAYDFGTIWRRPAGDTRERSRFDFCLEDDGAVTFLPCA